MTTDQTQATATDSGDIVARAGTYYRNTRYVMFVLLVGMGGWFLYDGYVKYPRENAIIADLSAKRDAAVKAGDEQAQTKLQADLKEHVSHNDSALFLQRALGFGLPPLGVLALLWSLHRSRGEYRLSGTKLSVPGHPTIDLDEIDGPEINNDLWDRKGIVWLPYKTGDGTEGEIVLDDFLYDRPPTDAIYARIAQKFGLTEDEDEQDDEETGEDDEGSTESKSESESESETK